MSHRRRAEEDLGARLEGGLTGRTCARASPTCRLKLFGAGTDSGTFDYFTDVINGEEGASRTDYSASEDDNVTVQGVAGAKGGLGYFGFSYFEENQDTLKALEIDDGYGCVAPSVETAQAGDYTPLVAPAVRLRQDVRRSSAPRSRTSSATCSTTRRRSPRPAQFVPLNEEQLAKAEQKLEDAVG